MGNDIGIRNSMELLYKGVQKNAWKSDEEFFSAIKYRLNRMCTAIAKELSAQSCAVFFVTNDPSPEHCQKLVMRGASGRLLKTFEFAYKPPGKKPGPGIEYESILCTGSKSGRVKKASLTQIVWHCGLARWANTRAEMERLRKSSSGGRGDRKAYPGPTLRKVFRNCVIVPIFAYGRVSSPLPLKSIMKTIKETGSVPFSREEAKHHQRFMRNHRVIGVLKVENKELSRIGTRSLGAMSVPRLQRPAFKGICPASVGKFRCPAYRKCSKFRRRVRNRIRQFPQDGLTRYFYDQLSTPEFVPKHGGKNHREIRVGWGYKWNNVCRDLVDSCVKSFDATFSNQDVELLVALAMQIGRILPWRTVQYASDKSVILDESEVGSLLIRQTDIDGIAMLNDACGHVAQRVKFLLEKLKSELEFEEQCKITNTRKWGLLEQRNPIRSIDGRTKAYARLLRKAILRHDLEWEKELLRTSKDDKELFTNQHLIRRLLGAKYDIRDVAGVRVTCDYLSDVERVVDSICSGQEEWNIKIREIQNKLDRPDVSGYRAIHMDLLVKASSYIPKGEEEVLKKLLENLPMKDYRRSLVEKNVLWLPCELQIRTAYEDSWAKKSHDLVYKLDRSAARLPKNLLDLLQILSNNLFEADRLSDIVQEQIFEFLTPHSGDEFRLRGLLGESLPKLPGDTTARKLPAKPEEWPFRYLTFAMDCARELYRNNIRYSGASQYSHAISVAVQLVSRFGLFRDDAKKQNDENEEKKKTDKEKNIDETVRRIRLFALAMLHDCWLAASNTKGIIDEKMRNTYWEEKDCVKAFMLLLRNSCSAVIETYGDTIVPEKIIGTPPPHWVRAFLYESRKYWRGELGDAKHFDDHAKNFWQRMAKLKLRDEDMYDICSLRASMLIDELEDIPDLPNKERRRAVFQEAYDEFRHVRDSLSGIPGESVITNECFKVMHNIAMRLGFEIPIHWYE